ncbi:MAG: NADH-quinone oxidoreductase subunit N [Chloroflexi bacterium]|nr:MAG: NADH-quinone oxidoreductase subunit N [Chloroflexota bacterium]
MSTMILAILPEILLLVLAVMVLLLDAVWKREQRRRIGWITAAGLVIIAVVSIFAARPGAESELLWGGMIRHDWLSFIFKMLFLFAGAATVLLAMDVQNLGERGEFYVLMLASIIGMNFMASATNLIMLYLAIETTSIPLYILAGFMTRDEKSTESGFKYLLFGALSSTVMLYGFSLLFGFTGTTDLAQLASVVTAGEVPLGALIGSLGLIMVGFAFKISAFPFHFWAPDVYEGAPTPVAGFLSTASKAAGFAVLVRFFMTTFPGDDIMPFWVGIITVISVLTMTFGNAVALAQKNIKRMLAYSSIAHAGYALIGVVAFSEFGLGSVVYYLFAYVLTNLAAFGVVVIYWRIVCSDDISSYAGLSRRSPGLALAMLVAFLSLAGMPPLGGFVAKVFVFAAAVQSNLIWLAFVGVLNSIVGLYYYLTVLKVVYLYRSEDENKPLPVTRSQTIALAVLCAGIIVVGTVFGPWFGLSSAAASAIFHF